MTLIDFLIVNMKAGLGNYRNLYIIHSKKWKRFDGICLCTCYMGIKKIEFGYERMIAFCLELCEKFIVFDEGWRIRGLRWQGRFWGWSADGRENGIETWKIHCGGIARMVGIFFRSP